MKKSAYVCGFLVFTSITIAWAGVETNSTLSLAEQHTASLLADANLLLNDAKECIRENEHVLKAKEAMLELSESMQTNAQNLAKKLETQAANRESEVENLTITILLAEQRVVELRHLTDETERPGKAYYDALWQVRLLKAKQKSIEAQMQYEKMLAEALKQEDSEGTNLEKSTKRNPARSKVYEKK